MAQDFVEDWKEKIKQGIEFRKKFSDSNNWPKYRNMYRGKFPKGVLPVNRIFSYGRALIPRVYFSDPAVSVTPTHPDLVWHAKVVEAIDNMLIREVMLKRTFKQAILDAYLCGIGPIKVGYDSEFGFVPELAIDEGGETLTQHAKETGEQIEYQQEVKPGMPWALRVMPEHIVVPWGATDARSLPWIAHYIVRPLEDVKNDTKYRNTKDLKGTKMPNFEKPMDQFRPGSRPYDIDYAELWEIRDVKKKRIIVICEDKVLLNDDDPLQFEGLPYVFIAFNEDPEFFWPIADATILAPQQEELNEVRTQISRHRQIALLKFLALRGALKEEEVEKFLSGHVGPFVWVEPDAGSVAGAVTTVQPHIPPDLYTDVKQVLSDMQEELGFSVNQLGEFSPYHGKTATESMIVQQAFSVRVDERRDIVADALVEVIRKFNQMIFRFWNEERVVRIVSPQGEPFWVRFTGEEIEGEYHLRIDPDTGVPMTRMLKYQLAKELFAMFNGDQLVDQMMLRQMLLGYYAQVDPMAKWLLQTQPGVSPEALAAARQPVPVFGQRGVVRGQPGPQPSPEQAMSLGEVYDKYGTVKVQ